MRRMYPFTWLNIMSVATKSIKRRNSLSDQAKGIIIQKVVAGGERSLDLLFGTLTFLNWFVANLQIRRKDSDFDFSQGSFVRYGQAFRLNGIPASCHHDI
jgi:hypothetical protein